MTLDPYGDADLVTLYEIDNPAGRDHEFYDRLVGELQAKTIIDRASSHP